ncbi:MAG: hypothetical protein AAFZ63_10070 [Bacteroidota bacterium]
MYKTLICLLLFSLLTTVIEAQINVGSIRQTRMKAGDFEPEDLDALREAETLFIMRPGDESEIEEWQAMLDEVWTVNKVTAITRGELPDYVEDSGRDTYAFLGLEGHATTVQMKTTSYVVSHYYLHLSMPGDEIPYSDKELKRFERRGETPEPKFEIRSFARIAVYPDGELMVLADQFRHSFSLTDGQKNDHMEFVYNEANFYNWEPGFLKNALQEVNRVLSKGETRWIFGETLDEAQLSALRRKTLYVPDYLLIKYNKFNGNESKRHEVDDLFGDYEYRYALIDASELSTKILAAEEPFYYFNYVRSSTDAFYTITNALTGEIVYGVYDPVTYNIKSKNIKEMNRAIEKAD